MEHKHKALPFLAKLVSILVLAFLLICTDETPSVLSAYPPLVGGGTSTVTYKAYLPLIPKTFPPPEAMSYYVTNLATLYDLGRALGIQDSNTLGQQDHLVTLDYGYPAKQGSDYGVFLVFDKTGTFHPTTDVINSAIEFAIGYYYGTGSDHDSHLRMVVGVNSCCDENTLAFFQGHGTAWGQAVNSISSGISWYSSQVDVVGGNDIEMSYNDPYATTQWFNNYMAASTCVPASDSSVDGCFYNFGNLAISISGTSCATSRSSPWVACDVWYLSWGAQKNGKRFARPLPEIYHGSETRPPWGTDATAWKDLSLFSANQMYAGKMYFVGSLTQRAECGDGCGSGNNYPWEGYLLLYGALASNSTTSMNLRWSTDIMTQP